MISRINKERFAALCPGDSSVADVLYALWAARVLDNWARKHGRHTPAPELWEARTPTKPDVYRISIPAYELTEDMGFIRRPFEGRTADDARIAAASDLVIEDSTINPIPGIEWL